MKTIYSKFTDYRRARFRLMTSICETEKDKVVIKKNAPGGDAGAHLEQIAQNRTLLEDLYQGAVEICPCRWNGAALEFPYLEGTSCLDLLRDAAAEGGLPALLDGLREYTGILEGPGTNQVPFRYTDAFQLVFGRVATLEGVPALSVSNLDASPGNLILDAEGRLNLIDYEWVFDFPIPRDFILFRHLRFLYAEQGLECLADLTLGDLLSECGVELDMATLNAMYDGFQQYVCVEDNAALSCAQIFERHRKPMYEGGEGQFRRPPHFLFLDKGEGFSEQEKLVFPADDGQLDLCVDVEGVRSIRFDPFEGQRTIVDPLTFVTDSGEELSYDAPSMTQAGDRIILNQPANAQVEIPEGARTLTISGFALFMNERDEYWLGQTQAAQTRLDETIQALDAERQQWAAERAALEASADAQREQQALALQASEVELGQSREQLAHEAAEHEARVQQLTQQLASARNEAEQLRQGIDALHNSTSWKATGWLRKLSSALRRSQ